MDMADCNFALEGLDWESDFPSSLLEPDLPWHSEFAELESTYVIGKNSLYSTQTSSILCSPRSPNIMNFQLPTNSMQEQDHDANPLGSGVVIPINTSDGSPDSSNYNRDTPVSSHQFSASEASLTNSPIANFSKKKKRDPRLQCPNFVAGRIPCSCPEEDELEADVEVEAVGKKRSKAGVICQVPSCGEDISHLKGYHQRHRVCLACANSPNVILKDLPHRYCQQCGKFHRLSDFDEGKRSCRRKLERHNKLRRRRPVEEEADAQNCKAQSLVVDADGSNIHSEGAATQNVKIVAASRTRHVKTMSHAKQNAKENVAHHLTILPHTDRTSDGSSGSTRRPEEDVISSNNGKRDGPHLRAALVGIDAEQTIEHASSTKHTLNQEPTNGLLKATGHYVSHCPSGRISFKLYDWNPADFPRMLRQQIFEWLASMPVELETYVRPGCIILTFFVAMPQLIWDKVLAEWKGQVQTIILNSGVKLLGTGQITTQMVKNDLLMKNGKVTNACYKDLVVPFVLDLYPRSLEAGCSTQIYVFGFNFTGGRFLLSFGEQYAQCSDWELVDYSHIIPQKVGNSVGNIEVHRVSVLLPDSQKFGLAYAEVENVCGLSNFMPLVVADRPICLEINRLNLASTVAFNIFVNVPYKEEKSVRSQHHIDLLVDLGWALKYSNQTIPFVNLEAQVALTYRLQALLLFLLEHSCYAIIKRLVQTSISNLVTQSVQYARSLDMWQNANKWTDNNTRSFAGRLSVPSEIELKGKSTLRLPVEGDGNGMIDKKRTIKPIKGPHEPKIEANQSQKSALVESCHRNKIDILLLEERILVARDGWKGKAHTGISFLFHDKNRFGRVLLIAVGVVTVCAGLCFILQHPHEVAEVSVSLRRCLWGSRGSIAVPSV